MNTNTRKCTAYVLVITVASLFTAPLRVVAAEPDPMQINASPAPADTHTALPDPPREARAPSGEEMFFDGLIVRPLMAAVTIVGTAVFLATLPLSAIGGNANQAAKRFVAEPAKATLGQCLGCLPEYSMSGY